MADMNPNNPVSYFKSMGSVWSKINAVLGGTSAMREAGITFLPKHESESQSNYEHRLSRSTLLNVFGTTVKTMVGQAFANPVSLEDMPKAFAFVETSIDGRGTTLSNFARRVFDCTVKRAEAFVLVDMQPARGEATRADQKANNRRPYAVFIRPSNMLALQAEVVNGEEIVTYARWQHSTVEPDGYFGEVTRQFVTEWTIDEWIRWEKVESEWVRHSDGTNQFQFEGRKAVPMVHISVSDTDDDGLRTPPLMDLVDKNVEHWQSASDQRNILTFSRFPILFLAGVGKDGIPTDDNGKAELGPRTAIRSDDAGAKGSYLEPGGAAIQAGERDLQTLKEEMAVLASQPYITRPGNITATRSVLEEGKSSSLVEHWVQITSEGMVRVLRMIAAWQGQAVDPKVTIKPEFAAMVASAEKARFLLEARRNGDLNREEFWREAKGLDFVSDAFDTEQNEVGLQAEADGFEGDVTT